MPLDNPLHDSRQEVCTKVLKYIFGSQGTQDKERVIFRTPRAVSPTTLPFHCALKLFGCTKMHLAMPHRVIRLDGIDIHGRRSDVWS